MAIEKQHDIVGTTVVGGCGGNIRGHSRPTGVDDDDPIEDILLKPLKAAPIIEYIERHLQAFRGGYERLFLDRPTMPIQNIGEWLYLFRNGDLTSNNSS